MKLGPFIVLLCCLFYSAFSGACGPETASQSSVKAVNLETLVALTPPIFRAQPLYFWPERVWRRAADKLSDEEVLQLQQYLILFSRNPAKADAVLRARYSAIPQHLKYICAVEDNVMSGYLLLWYRGEQNGDASPS